MNGTLSVYECKFSDGYHEVVKTLKAYHMQKNLYERFLLTGSGKQKFKCKHLHLGVSARAQEPKIAKL